MKSFVSLIGFLRNFKWDLSVTFAAAAHHKPKSQRSTVSHTNLPVDTTPNNLLYLSHTPAHASILPPSSSWDGSHLFPSSLFRPHLCKQLVANIIWLRREYIHHASLSFSKVTSLKNMKSCPAVGMYSCAQVLCVRLKAPSKSSLKAQTTFCLFSEAKARGIFCLVYASLCSQLPCPVSEWTNTQHDKTHHSVAIRCPIPPLALVIPSHSSLSHPGKDSQRRVFLTYFQWPLNVAWLAWSIFCTLVFLFSLCTALISRIRLPLS